MEMMLCKIEHIKDRFSPRDALLHSALVSHVNFDSPLQLRFICKALRPKFDLESYMKSSAFIYEESHLDACSVVQLRKFRKVDFVHLGVVFSGSNVLSLILVTPL